MTTTVTTLAELAEQLELLPEEMREYMQLLQREGRVIAVRDEVTGRRIWLAKEVLEGTRH